MVDQSKFRVVGAFVVGFAIVAGAFTVKSLQSPSPTPSENQAVASVEAPARVLIDVADSDNNGLEDWREEFITSSPITITQSTDTPYVEPDTLTGQVGVNFMQSIMSSKVYGEIGRTNEEVIADTAEQVRKSASDTIFDIKDIILSKDSSDEAVRTYANGAAKAIIDNDAPGLRNELTILQGVLKGTDPNGEEDLKTLAKVYLKTRNTTLNLPVPPQLVKEHLDLINVYNALYIDIDSMSKTVTDPMLALVRFKRYEDDARGLTLALQNMYNAVEPYAKVFKADDPAILFVSFSPNFQ